MRRAIGLVRFKTPLKLNKSALIDRIFIPAITCVEQNSQVSGRSAAFRRVEDRFERMAIRIDDEGGVVGRPVVEPQAGRAVVPAAAR